MTAPTSFNKQLYFLKNTALQCIPEAVRFSILRHRHFVPQAYTITLTTSVIYVLHGGKILHDNQCRRSRVEDTGMQ